MTFETAPSSPAKAPIAVFIITRNEERNLPFALASVCPWASQVFVLDSGSTDRTKEIAEAHGAVFVHRDWDGYVRQKNWGLANLPITAPWVFILDADEAISDPLRDELTQIASLDACPEQGFYVNRYFVFLGKTIRRCGFYPSWNLRFFRKGKAVYEDREVHEHMVVDGPVGYLNHDMEHYDRRGMAYYIAKHNEYSTLEARAMHRRMIGAGNAIAGTFFGGGPVMRRRWLKDRVWPRLPARWLARWVYMYILRLGFLDGAAGFHFCLFMTAYEHQIGLKLKELMSESASEKASSPKLLSDLGGQAALSTPSTHA